MINCEKCKSKTICKFREYADETNSAIRDIKVMQNSPFVVNAGCNMFSEVKYPIGESFNNSSQPGMLPTLYR